MLKIKLEDADELYFLILELGAIAYLQDLIQYDNSDKIGCIEGLEFAKKYAESYLLEKEKESVIKIRELVEKEGFLN